MRGQWVLAAGDSCGATSVETSRLDGPGASVRLCHTSSLRLPILQSLRQDLTSPSSALEPCPAWDPRVDTAHRVLRHKRDLWEEWGRTSVAVRAPSGILTQIALGGRG